MELLPILAWTAALSALLFSGCWALSLPLRNASIVDVLWGPAFAAVAGVAALLAGGSGSGPSAPLRVLLLVALPTLWGARLGLHIFLRGRGKGEDPRYAAGRAAGGVGWPVRSLGTVFLLQAAILWGVSLPLQTGIAAGGSPGWIGWLGVLVALAGGTMEAVADAQLTRFRRDPQRRGCVLDSGLWRWSRHPNYFGDALFWWGIWLLGGADSGAWWTFASPLLMTLLLRYVSGVTLTERGAIGRTPEYAEYVRRTPAFFPRIPRG